MKYKVGDRVRHPTMEEWGLGVVLEASNDVARMFFEKAGQKSIVLKAFQPTLVFGADADSAFLDNLKIEKGEVGGRYKSLKSSMAYFSKQFPGGFRGARFGFHERTHKEEIRDEVQSQLSQTAMKSLIAEGNYREICIRAIKLTNHSANAMIFKNEKMALRAGLEPDAAAQKFASALFGLLHEQDRFDEQFSAFVNCLHEIGAAKWTTATYFLFFMHPEKHMFVKPTITRNAADICAFDINYRPELNLQTYRRVMELSAYLHWAISPLAPRDMIDVQSFMWCIAPGTYTSSDK